MSEPAGRYAWDLDTPHPNVELEALRVHLKQALADLRDTVAGVQAAQDGVDDTYWLSDVLFTLADAALAETAQLRTDLDDLRARLTALDPAPTPPTEEA